jgi:hypothetical protein
MISDDKVGDKGVRVRCKKCCNIVTVRPKSESEPTEPERDDTQVSGTPDDSLPEKTTVDQPDDQGDGFNVGDEEIGDALDSFLGDEGEEEEFDDDDEDRPDFDRQATRVFSVDEMQKVQEEREQAEQEAEERQGISDLYESAQADEQEASGEHPAEEPPAADEPSEEEREKVEWYAAVDEQQVGPMNITEIGTRWEQGEFDAETLVWKTGFDDWLPVFEVNELKFLLAEQEQEAPPEEEQPAQEEMEEEEEREEASGWGEDTWGEEEEQEGGEAGSDEEFYEEDDALSAASSAAFAGADVDWKPSAVAELNALAEEELASLKPPPDPEPEEEQLPFGEDLSSLPDVEDAEGSGEVAEMDDGDSSIIGQIAAEEEAAAKVAEEERVTEEKRQEEVRKKQEEEELAAQEAARREREAEKREKAAPPPEQVIPPRGGIPKWALGVMGGSGLVIVILLGFIAYKLASGSSDDEVKPAAEPIKPHAAAGVHTPPKGSGETKPAPVVPTPPPPAPETVAKTTETPPKPEAGKTIKDEKKTTQPPKRKPPASRKKKRRKKVVVKEKDPAPPPPEPEPKPPPSRKRKGSKDLLDFDDEEAFSEVTGSKDPVKRAPPPPEKKALPPLSNADVLGVMRQHIAEFKACNRKQKGIDPSVKGKMVVSFIVNPSGKVGSVKVTTGQFKKTFVASCISKVIRQLSFPKFGGKPKKVPFPFTVK